MVQAEALMCYCSSKAHPGEEQPKLPSFQSTTRILRAFESRLHGPRDFLVQSVARSMESGKVYSPNVTLALSLSGFRSS